MTVLDDFWDEYREMLPNAIFSLYGNSILTLIPTQLPHWWQSGRNCHRPKAESDGSNKTATNFTQIFSKAC